MFLYLRHLLTIDSLIFEPCLKILSFWHPNLLKIHLQTHKVYQFVDDCVSSQLLFVLGGPWEGFGKLIGASQSDFWAQNEGFRHSLGPPWSCIFVVSASFLLSWPLGTAIILVIFIIEPLRSQFASKNELETIRTSIQNRSNIYHTCMFGFNFNFSWFCS